MLKFHSKNTDSYKCYCKGKKEKKISARQVEKETDLQW